MRWSLLLMMTMGCSSGSGAADQELYLYMVDTSGEAETGVELRFDRETSRVHPPGSEYVVGSFRCQPQVGMGDESAAFSTLCSADGASANLRVTVPWRECASMTVEGSLIAGERVLDYWVRCEREPEARRTQRSIVTAQLVGAPDS